MQQKVFFCCALDPSMKSLKYSSGGLSQLGSKYLSAGVLPAHLPWAFVKIWVTISVGIF
jgi:hypothetical protein